MNPQLRSSCFVLIFSLLVFTPGLGAQENDDAKMDLIRETSHQDPQWQNVQAHLPDPMTAQTSQLEMAADVLRARRFPVDALEYYSHTLQRGVDQARQVQVLNKMGVTAMELRNSAQARAYFKQALKIQKKSAEAWNNLGAVEYLERHLGPAISNYKRAIKLDKKSSSYHSNLGTAYFEQKDFESARKEFATALKLDPQMFNRRRGTSGITAHMLSPEDHARFCFEMARLYAKNGDEENMLHSLQRASEGGFDVQSEMRFDSALAPYRKDPRVILIVQNAQALRAERNATAVAAGTLPPLPPALHE